MMGSPSNPLSSIMCPFSASEKLGGLVVISFFVEMCEMGQFIDTVVFI